MNTIGLLLVLGLAFFAMKQKSEKTRNMLLVVSALLGFCMFSAEGFTVASVNFGTVFGSNDNAAAPNTDVTVDGPDITVTGSGLDQYTFTNSSDLDSGSLTGITCKVTGAATANGVVGIADAAAPDPGSVSTPTDISNLFKCNDNTEPTPDQSVTGDAADPCKCLTATEGNNLYCNSGWMNPDLLEYMGTDGETAPDYASAATCWEGSLDFIPTLGGMFTGRCTRKKGSTTSCPV